MAKSETETKKLVPREVPQIDKDIREEAVRKNVHKKIMKSCDRCEGEIPAMKRKSIFFVERRERRG